MPFFLMGNQNIKSLSNPITTLQVLNFSIVQYFMKIVPDFMPVDVQGVYAGFPSCHLYAQLPRFHIQSQYKQV